MKGTRHFPAGRRTDRGETLFVWGVWAGMLALLIVLFLRHASPVPLAEDWVTVPFVTGHPADLLPWLWQQNNEHRMPIARLLLLGALKAGGGDYRAGGLLNLVLLAGGAAALILFTRRLRGRTDVADAFFPLTLLHFGHSVDVLFPFQITFVLSLAFIVTLGCTLFLPSSVARKGGAVIAGGCLLLLPLSGFIGLLFVPPLAAYLLYAGWALRTGSHGWPVRTRRGLWLMTAAGISVVLGLLYFVGYYQPWWNPPNPGVLPSLKTALKVLSLGFGPAPQFWWEPGVLAAILFLSASCWASARRLVLSAPHRHYALGASIFLVAGIGFAAAVGWGRAGSVPDVGIPLRYIDVTIPAFVAAYLTWVVSDLPLGVVVTRALAVTMLVLLPVNTIAGHRLFADWYHEGMTRLQSDIDRGMPIEQIAVTYNRFLAHYWGPEELARHIHMLREAGIAPFDRAATTREELREP